MKVIKETTFRSEGRGVNKTDNMVSVTLHMTRNDWIRLQRLIKKEFKNED